MEVVLFYALVFVGSFVCGVVPSLFILWLSDRRSNGCDQAASLVKAKKQGGFIVIDSREKARELLGDSGARMFDDLAKRSVPYQERRAHNE